jgi:hypothetical protein
MEGESASLLHDDDDEPEATSSLLGRRGEGRRSQSDQMCGGCCILTIGTLVACVLWLLPPMDELIRSGPSIEALLPLTHQRQRAPPREEPPLAARSAAPGASSGWAVGAASSYSSSPPPPPPPPPPPLASAAPPPLLHAATASVPAGRAAPPRDLVFGVVAFRPDGCSQWGRGKACDRTAYYTGLKRWVRSVRRHLRREETVRCCPPP